MGVAAPLHLSFIACLVGDWSALRFSSPFTILTLASGHTFLSVAACILKDFLVA